MRTENALLQQKIEVLEKKLDNPFAESPELIAESTVLIAIENQLQQARETNFCLGQSTEFGILTSTICCIADEISIIDLESKSEIDIVNNSIWLDEEKSICIINTMNDFNFVFRDSNMTDECMIKIFDHNTSNFDYISLNNNIIHENENFFLDIELEENTTILNGSSIICDNVIFGLVLSGKNFS